MHRLRRRILLQVRCLSSCRENKLISGLVINQPGTLAKVANAFAAAHENISSLSVLPTAVPEIARVTIVCSLSQEGLRGLRQRLLRLVSVIFLHITSIEEWNDSDDLIGRAHVLLKVSLACQEPEYLDRLKKLVYAYGGKLFYAETHATIHVMTNPRDLEEFIAKIRSFSVIELQRSSPVFVETIRSTLNPNRHGVTSHSVPPDVYASICTTEQLHTDLKGKYSDERLKLHARIAHQLYSAGPENLSNPKLVLLLGVPGSGKSTILRQLDMDLSLFLNFDVDECLALLPEYYHAMLNVGLGNDTYVYEDLPNPHVRYRMCQDEARFILKKNRDLAIMRRKNVILHGSGRSYENYSNLIRQAKSSGYETHLVGVDISAEIAEQRVKKRSGQFGRDVPIDIIHSAAESMTKHFPRLTRQVDHAHLFDSTIRPPKLIWSRQKGQVKQSLVEHPVQRKFGL